MNNKLLETQTVQQDTKAWLEERLDYRRRTFINEPDVMVSFFRNEQQRVKEYNGRQLLELIQNADDEIRTETEAVILIELKANTLIIANNGTPFSQKGIQSLMTPNVSAKIDRADTIGNKGLGFRSILNWAKEVWIKSGGFSIEYSRANAVAFLESIIAENPAIVSQLKEIIQDEPYPIATLAAPKWKEDTTGFEEFDTYIITNLKDNISSKIESQIDDLGLETLLFLNNIKEIKIKSPQRNFILKRNTAIGEFIQEIVKTDFSGKIIEHKKWTIYQPNESNLGLPESLRTGDFRSQYRYDLRIAVSEKIDDEVNRLFTYFKTKVPFPFPVIVHGTFELSGDRNQLVDTPVNKFLLGKLAELMVTTALKISGSGVNWRPLKLLAFEQKNNSILEELGFFEILIEEIKKVVIFPTIQGKYLKKAEVPIYLNNDFSEIFEDYEKFNVFPTLVQPLKDEKIKSLLSQIGLKSGVEKSTFSAKINRISSLLNLNQRAALINLISKNSNGYGLFGTYYKFDKENMPNLFIDNKRTVIPSANTIILPRGKEKIIETPDWIQIEFINTALLYKLKSVMGFQINNAAQALKLFNLDEYRLDTIFSKIIRATRYRLGQNDIPKQKTIKELIQVLLKIFNSGNLGYDRKQTIPILTRNNNVENTNKLYFGIEYGNEVTETLMKRVGKDCFIANQTILGLEETEEIIPFLTWLGVKKYPQKVLYSMDKSHEAYYNYRDYLFENLNYPYVSTAYNEQFLTLKHLKENLHPSPRFHSVFEIYAFENCLNILKTCEFSDIVKWVLTDENFRSNLFKNFEESRTQNVTYHLTNNRRVDIRLRPNEILNYIVWQIQNTDWVKVSEDSRVKPSQCIFSSSLKDFEPIIYVPSFDYKQFKKEERKQVDAILERMGFCFSIGDFPTDAIYQLLLNLPEKDPEGKIAPKLYRKIIENFEVEDEQSIFYQSFTGNENSVTPNGKIWAEVFINGEKKRKYLSVDSVYYVENPSFCEDIKCHFPIAVLPKRRGNKKIKKLFGINPLINVAFNLLKSPIFHSLQEQFNKKFELLKPFLLAYRIDKVAKDSQLEREKEALKKLDLKLCQSLKLGFKNQEINIGNYEYISVEEHKNQVFIHLKNNYDSLQSLNSDIKFRSVIADIICGVFKIEGGHEQFNLLLSELETSRRKEILEMTFPDDWEVKLQQANIYFDSATFATQIFWSTILKVKHGVFDLASPISVQYLRENLDRIGSLEEFENIFKSIDYESINTTSNYSLLKSLFEKLNITAKLFNNSEPYEKINFSVKHQDDLRRAYDSVEKSIQWRLFEYLSSKNIEEKQTFKNLLRTIKSIRNKECPSGFTFNAHQTISTHLEEIVPYLELDFTTQSMRELMKDIYQPNRTNFLNMLNSQIFIKEFLEISENDSLIYFNELEHLKELYEQEYLTPTIDLTDSENSENSSTLSPNHKPAEYAKGIISKNAKLSNGLRNGSTNGGKKFGFSGDRKGISDNQKRGIGIVGERCVYDWLKANHKVKEVYWESKFGEQEGFCDIGDDSLGYDIRYILKEDNEERFVEVKSTPTLTNQFYISHAELRFAELSGEKYELFFIKNIFEKPQIFNLGNIFIMDDNVFEKEAENYKIFGFQIDELKSKNS